MQWCIYFVLLLTTFSCSCFVMHLQCSSKDDSASRALIAERNMMEVRIAELERRNTELEEQLHRSSDPLELRLQQLAEESAQLQKKLRVCYRVDFVFWANFSSDVYAAVLVCSKVAEFLLPAYFLCA